MLLVMRVIIDEWDAGTSGFGTVAGVVVVIKGGRDEQK